MSKRREVRFYSRGTSEDQEAERLLKEAKVPYLNFEPTPEEKTPIIKQWFWTYKGVGSIKTFIERWRNGKLPGS